MRGETIVVVVMTSLASSCSRSSFHPTETYGPEAAAPKAAHIRSVAPGDAPADLDKSRVVISVIKDRDTANPVIARFSLRDGAVSLGSPGSAKLSVDLDTVESSIPVRNERLRNIFFETSALGWDTAEIAVPALGAEVVRALGDKRRVDATKLQGTLKVHGHTAPITMLVEARYADDGRLSVRTTAPVEVKISDLGLTDNLHRLSSICMHDSIDDLVKVDVALEFAPPAHD
jgi:YceI-like domain